MDKLNSTGKWALIGVVALVLVVIAVVWGGQQSQTPSPQIASSTASGTPSGSSGGSNGSSATPASPASPAGGTGKGASPAPVAPPRTVIHLITPVKNDQWKINTANPIVWDQEAGVTGEIDLLDAGSKNLIGVILSETGPHQTSYSWDTRQVYLLRYNPLKKDIIPGTYILRIKFDGNNLSNVVSFPFTVTQ